MTRLRAYANWAILVIVVSISRVDGQGDVVQAFGHVHRALGQSSLSVGADATGRRRLEVSNIGSSGQDGVSVSRPIVSQPGDVDGDGIDLAFDSAGIGTGSSLTALCRVKLSDSTSDAAEVRCFNNGASLDVSSSVLDLARFSSKRFVQLYLDGLPVASRQVVGDDPFTQVLEEPAPALRPWPLDIHIYRDPLTNCLRLEITFGGVLSDLGAASARAGNVHVVFDGQVIECDRISVAVQPVNDPPMMVEAVEVRCSSVASLSFSDESSSFRYHDWRWRSASSSSGRYHDWRWRSIGEASMGITLDAAQRRRLEVRNLGSSGQDGVSLPGRLFEADSDGDGVSEPMLRGGFEMAFDTTGVQTGSSFEARVRFAAGGLDDDNDGFAVRCVHGDQSLDLSSVTLLPGRVSVNRAVAIRFRGETVATTGQTGDGVFAHVLKAAAGAERPLLFDYHIVWGPDGFYIEITFNGHLTARTGGGGGSGGSVLVAVDGRTIECDAIRLKAAMAAGDSPLSLRGGSILLSNIQGLTITDASSTFDFDGTPHHTLSESAFSISNADGSRGLAMANIGSSGQDGVAVALRATATQPGDATVDGFAMAFDSEGVRAGSTLEAHVIVSQPSDLNGDGFLRIAHTGAALDLSVFGFDPVILAAQRVQVSAVRGGVRVAKGDVNGDGFVARLVPAGGAPGGLIAWPKDLHIWWNTETGQWCIRATWDGNIGSSLLRAPVDVGIALELAGQTVPCDAVEIEISSSKLPMLDPQCFFAVRCSDLDSLTILDESTKATFAGQDHHTLGQAFASISNAPGLKGLAISNIGSSGQDGVAVVADLDSDGLADSFSGFEVAFDSSGVRDGSQLALRAKGIVKGIGGTPTPVRMSAAAVGDQVDLRVALGDPGQPTDTRKRKVSAYLGGVLVGGADVSGDSVARVISSSQSPGQIPWLKDIHIQFYPFFEIRFTYDRILTNALRGAGGQAAPELTVEIAGQTFVCDSIGVVIDDVSGLPESLDSVDLTASNLDSFTITDENVIPDAPPAPQFERGDSNGDGGVDIGDAIWSLSYLFTGGRAPPCFDAADANDTGKLDLSDPIFELNFLFLGGREPPSPGTGACGPDPTEDQLECAVEPGRCRA